MRQLTRAALRPLDHVAVVAEGIAAGDVDRRLRPSRSDTELGRMAAAFDRMVDALQEALERSRTAEATTRRFVADASHELRTPIATLQATAETLLREQPGRPDRDALEARLAGDAARLGRLVADLLDLARLDGPGPPPPARSTCGSWPGRRSTRPGRRAAGSSSRWRPTGPRRCGATPGRWRGWCATCWTTLPVRPRPAGCASSWTAMPARPVCGSSTTGRACRRPSGSASSSGFVRLDGRGARPGAGLGLAIARAIARQHGGDLRCDAVEHGASFTLLLPAAG